LCENSKKSVVVITNTPEEFHSYFDDEEIEVLDVMHLTGDLDRIVYQRKAEFQVFT
jgi:hypothetical protein